MTALLARWTEKLAGGPQAGTIVSARNPVTTVMVAVLVLVVHTCITHLAMHTAELDLIHTATSIETICTITELTDIDNTLTDKM